MADKYIPKYFTPEEFKNCIPSCSIDDMDDDFLFYLDRIRSICGFPIKLNSAYRSVDYELSVGRDGTSSHTKGIAADINCFNSFQRAAIIDAVCDISSSLWNYPVRIGVAKNFLHIDIDWEKSQGIWLY